MNPDEQLIALHAAVRGYEVLLTYLQADLAKSCRVLDSSLL